MRLRPLHTLIVSLSLSPACGGSGPVDESEAPSTTVDERSALDLSVAELPPAASGGAAPDAPAPAEDDPTATLGWPLGAWRIEIDADRVDAVARDGDALAFAGRSGNNVRLGRFTLDPKQPGTTTLAASIDAGPIGPDPVALAPAGRGLSALAVWHDPDGAVWAVPVDEHLAEAKPQKILDPADGKAVGPTALAPADAGTLACIGLVGEPLHCAMLDARGATDGWSAIGKTADLLPEALVPGPHGWLLLAGTCRPKTADTCKRKDLIVVRLGEDGMPPKKRPTLQLPEVEARRAGLVVVPTDSGFVLVARRIGAGESSAWRVTDDAVKELDGKFTRTVGGLAAPDGGDEGMVFIEQGPLIMRQGHPVARYRVRPLGDDGKRKDALAWPSAIDPLMPLTVDQQVLSSDGLATFVEPIRKRHVRATVVRLGRAAGG